MQESNNEKAKAYGAYAHYLGVAVQMILIILLATVAGRFLDGYLGTKKPYCMAALALVGVAGAMFLLIKDALRKPKL